MWMEQKAAVLKSRAWIELSAANLRHNVSCLRVLLPKGCELMPVLKANAYGHGAVPVAKLLQKMGIRSFCVATAMEGIELRKNGIGGTILVLGYTHPEQFRLLRRFRLTQTVVDFDYAQVVNQFGRAIRVHIGVDTGMHRLGESCENRNRIRHILSMRNLRVDGIFTHLCADDTDLPQDKAFTARQARAFSEVTKELRKQGQTPLKTHILSSYGLLHYPELGGDYARMGIALYGVLSKPGDLDRCPADLRPVLSLKTRVAAVKELEAGESAGYSRAFIAKEKTRTATLAIGYADGLPRSLSCGAGHVLINGRPAPVVGQICMDQTIVDVSDIPGVTPGDTAIVIGGYGQKIISVCDLATQANTISNEILSRLGTRLERIVV